ncbi:MAG: radical SAM protein [Nitrospirota bacterium]|nr:radical SAM protein [Nitrospirota bacterium]
MYTDFPQYIQFYPTLKCNFNCTFCFNRGISSDTEVNLKDFERIVSVASDGGVEEIDMLGGEPTLHSGFSQITDILYTNKLKTTISTNGSNIPLLEKLSKKYNGELIKIGVSLNADVITEELHEYITMYKPILKSICSNKRIIPESAQHYLGLTDIEYYLLFMDTVHDDDLRTSLPFYEFLKELNNLKDIYNNVNGVFCSGFIPDTENYPVLQHVRCPAGTIKLSIMPDGSVYPCYLFFRHSEFRLGNILNDDFKSIWSNPILDFFRRFDKNICTNTRCEVFSDCHGGCPAVSLLIYNDIKAPDPRCVVRRV